MGKPNIVFASDHAGFTLKNTLLNALKQANLADVIEDVGCYSDASCDYPDFAHQACQKVQNGTHHFAILICGTGQGMCMTANTWDTCRAGVAWNVEIATALRCHNDANVLCLPSRHLSVEDALNIVQAFVCNAGPNEERHQSRIRKIKEK